MKISRLLSAILLATLLLSSCSGTLEAPEQPKAETEEKVTTEEILQKEDPSEDGVFNLLMIGNSACYYYTNELYQIAKTEGIEINVYNVYYSGCRLSQHWQFEKFNETPYQFFKTDKNGRVMIKNNCNLLQCLSTANWDVITMQEAINPVRSLDRDLVFSELEPYMRDLMKKIQTQFPQSTYMFHQTWASEVGYSGANGSILTKEAQEIQHTVTRDVALALCKKYDLERIPVGDAWQIARSDARVGDTLCHKDGKVGDYCHDGNTGGGRYLNGCVWFEVLTGKSCVGNTWRPDYDLSEEKVAALQEAAHKAVEDAKEAV